MPRHGEEHMPTGSWYVFLTGQLSMRRALIPHTIQLQPPQ